MANIKSQIKRNRQNERRRLQNRKYHGTSRNAVKNARLALASGDAEQAREATMLAVKYLDKAAQKGVIHRNNASRRKGRLMKELAKLENKA